MQCFDIIIIGAGPAGLSCAKSASLLGFSVAIIETLDLKSISDPQFDGRDIALTHASKSIMSQLGIWQKIAPEAISKITTARVYNSQSSHVMTFSTPRSDQLAWIISNHLIRKAAYQVVENDANIEIFTDVTAHDINIDSTKVHVCLNDGRTLKARLLLGADSRFSQTRRKLGIAASMHDFGKTMLVCQMQHELDHNSIACECFNDDHTLAVLPLNDRQSSVVITMTPKQIELMQAMPIDDFNQWVMSNFNNRLGAMELMTQRLIYPLVGVYSNSFIATRSALIGDAAVGMHPVTAHGFNFGLRSIQTLIALIRRAHELGRDIGSPLVLSDYQKRHRADTLPLYLATAGIVKLYTNNSVPARIARDIALKLADKMSPIKALMMDRLVDNKMNKITFPPSPLSLLKRLSDRAA